MSKTTYDIETSLTTDYRKSAWGIERIVLDSISNHLPEDSKGTVTTVKIKQDGQWTDLKSADKEKKVEEVLFEDNGSGYDAGLLSVLFSPKGADVLSVGQFGEGLKLVATASMRHGLKVEYRSRNWIARPYTKPETIDGHNIERLCFKVTENGDTLSGSRTVFTNPNPALVEEVFKLPKKVLALNDTYTELYNERDAMNYFPSIFSFGPISRMNITIGDGEYPSIDFKRFDKKIDTNPSPRIIFPMSLSKSEKTGLMNVLDEYGIPHEEKYNSRIIDLKSDRTALFVKGVQVERLNSIFSYDLGLENISPDRVTVDRDKMLSMVRTLLQNCSNTNIIERVLREAAEAHGLQDKGYIEFESLRDPATRIDSLISDFRNSEYTIKKELSGKSKEIYDSITKDKIPENLWVTTFKRLYGDNAVIASNDTNLNQDARIMGLVPVKMHPVVEGYLCRLGVKSVDEATLKKDYKWISIDELTESETQMLGRVQEINNVVLGQETPVDVRVYSGMFLESGREVESSEGVHVKEQDGAQYIGVKRSVLGKIEDFVPVYIHELGHQVTGAGDFDRKFSDFFVKALSKMAVQQMKK